MRWRGVYVAGGCFEKMDRTLGLPEIGAVNGRWELRWVGCFFVVWMVTDDCY